MRNRPSDHSDSNGAIEPAERCCVPMTTDGSGFRTLSTVVLALLAVPLVMMAVVMPLLVFTNGGHMMGGDPGYQLLAPLIPLSVLVAVACIAYVYAGSSDDSGRESDSALEALRARYARGELSDEEFENRRNRLQSNATRGSTASQDE